MDEWDAPGELYAYRDMPTLINAIRFLTSLDIPIIQPARVAEVVSTSSQTSPVKRSRRGGGIGIDIETFARVDLIHDIYSTAMPQHGVEWILNGTSLPTKARTEIVKLCTSSYTNITPSLTKMFVQLPPTFVIGSGRQHKFTLDATNAFYQYVLHLANTYNGREMPIVLDGIHHAFQNANTMVEVDAARSLALCAFVQVLFSHVQPGLPDTFKRKLATGVMEMQVPSRTTSPSVSSICFLTGKFQTLDIQMYNTFLDRLTRELSQTVSWSNAVTYRTQPSSYPGLSKTSLTLASGVQVPLRGSMLRGFSTFNKTYPEIARELQGRFCISYTKAELQAVFNYLFLLTKDEQTEFSSFVSTIANANLFRDAFRVEVAIANNAVFITNDRLSQAYYHMHDATNKKSSLLLTYKPGNIMCGVA